MTREEAKELLPIIQAFAEGKDIQMRNITDDGWDDIDDDRMSFCAKAVAYRIKPEPKYRPFRTQEECWEEMHKHPDFGWVKKINGGYKQIMAIHMDIFDKHCADFVGQTGTACFEFEYIYKNYTFTDGTPFGITSEESKEG